VKDPIGEGKELYSAGRLHGEWPADELLARIETMRVFRESLPVKKRKMRRLLIAGIVAAIVFAILCAALPGAAADARGGELGPWALVSVGALAAEASTVRTAGPARSPERGSSASARVGP